MMKEMELTGLGHWKWEVREGKESRPRSGSAEGLGAGGGRQDQVELSSKPWTSESTGRSPQHPRDS